MAGIGFASAWLMLLKPGFMDFTSHYHSTNANMHILAGSNLK
jgi:hypothetical protein